MSRLAYVNSDALMPKLDQMFDLISQYLNATRVQIPRKWSLFAPRITQDPLIQNAQLVFGKERGSYSSHWAVKS